MDSEHIKKEYKKYKIHLTRLQKEAYNHLIKLEKEKGKELGISHIQERPGGKIKDIQSILNNSKFTNSRYKYKNKEINNLLEIKDIAAIRIICHCRTDRDRVGDFLLGFLKSQQYLDIKHDFKDDKENPYNAIHIDFAKPKKIKGRWQEIYCEIQIRTVTADAWAIQDTRYNYKNSQAEGDPTDLSEAISNILDGCENLWEMIKRKTQEQDNKKNKK